MPTYSLETYLAQAPTAIALLLLHVIALLFVALIRQRETHARAATVHHAETLAQFIALRRALLVRRALDVRATLRRLGGRRGSRRRRGYVSAELLGVGRGAFDAKAAIDNAWDPEHDCPHCVAARRGSTEPQAPDGAQRMVSEFLDRVWPQPGRETERRSFLPLSKNN